MVFFSWEELSEVLERVNTVLLRGDLLDCALRFDQRYHELRLSCSGPKKKYILHPIAP